MQHLFTFGGCSIEEVLLGLLDLPNSVVMKISDEAFEPAKLTTTKFLTSLDWGLVQK